MRRVVRTPALLLSMFLLLSPTAHATSPAATTHNENGTITELMLNPRFDHMSRIASGLSFNSLGRANCTGTFTTYDEYDSAMTVILQKNENGRWTDIIKWSENYTGSGVKLMEKGYYVGSGRYRVVTTVQIFDDDGTVLETVTCDSPIKDR